MGAETIAGTVFDIRRFSTHDGDGIRTTVFFKGCPLSCVWCHNPEGISTRRRPLFFLNKCIGCGICTTVSTHGGMVRGTDGIRLDAGKTEDWDHIMEECPAEAVVWDSRSMTVEQVVAEVLKDQPFYRDNGGVTLSGGEPLLQADFCLELLKQLKAKGVHTAIETALYVPEQVLHSVLPYLDLIYADFKICDSEQHRKYVGMPNQIIKDNIRLLLESDKRAQVIVRTPLIPEITANQENIKQISRCIASIYPEVSYELLNYNPLAESKYRLIDQKYYFEKNPSRYSEQEMQQFADIARLGGAKQVIIEA